MKILNYLLLILLNTTVFGQNSKRWSLHEGGSIQWKVNNKVPHLDNIEMSGLQVSAILHYGVAENGELHLQKKLVYPMLRLAPNFTMDCLIVDLNEYNQQLLSRTCDPNPGPLVDAGDKSGLQISVNGAELKEYPHTFNLKGKLAITSSTNSPVEVTRVLFPSTDKPMMLEMVTMKNKGNAPCTVSILNNTRHIETDPAKSIYGSYILKTKMVVNGEVKDTIQSSIAPGSELSYTILYEGRQLSDAAPFFYSPSFELSKREKLVEEMFQNLVLETPNDTLDRAFAFAKLRTTESIFDTRGGLLHGPGGACYYAAIWANDQGEYANPFFPFLGNANGNESALNSYRHFARYMNPGYKQLPSAIYAEGRGIWNTLDRGDMAMIAYGAPRFVMETGNPVIARELWPLITWCLEYCDHRKTVEGVVASKSDELEGRFPTGKANLSTSSLAYGGYIGAALLADELGKPDTAALYRQKAKELRQAIETYFGAKVQGFDTYRYYTENTKLRAWICVPLVMGITERKEQTIEALFSPLLWTRDGILTESGTTTFWDRATLYAFRGLMANGETDRCMPYFNHYSTIRLLGEHVPYPVEAWPEGSARHLAAESALYCRVITEGLFGISPTGFNKFILTPWMPKGWDYMNLRNLHAFGCIFDIEVKRNGKYENITVKVAGGKTIEKKWDGKEAVEIVLE